MRSASSPPTVGSTTISNSVVITSMPVSIARLAKPRSARGTMLPKLRLRRDPSPAGFAHHASATGNLTMPLCGFSVEAECARAKCDHVKEPAGHHQVLVEVDHVVLIFGRQMHAKGSAEADKDKHSSGPSGV